MVHPLKGALPTFPRTPHLPGSRMGSDDISVAEEAFTAVLAEATTICVEEKLDGAQVRVRFDGKEDLFVGNRTKVLDKAYVGVTTPAKLQFRAIWPWMYQHRTQFLALKKHFGEVPIVYGEWLYARHTLRYDLLPALFIPYDIYLGRDFIDSVRTRLALTKAGFTCPPVLQEGLPLSVASLLAMAAGPSQYGPEREGAYVKLGDGRNTIGRYKVVRSDFTPREDFNEAGLLKNKLAPRVLGPKVPNLFGKYDSSKLRGR